MLDECPVFDRFVADMRDLIADCGDDEARLLDQGQRRLALLVAGDDWLPEHFMQADPGQFRQYMLFRRDGVDFSVLSVAWGPGGKAIAHDHTMWGLIGQLRGSERSRTFAAPQPGVPMTMLSSVALRPGETTFLSPTLCDIHDVENVSDGVSVSIHVYGGDLEAVFDRRHRYRIETGEAIPFESSYH